MLITNKYDINNKMFSLDFYLNTDQIKCINSFPSIFVNSLSGHLKNNKNLSF